MVELRGLDYRFKRTEKEQQDNLLEKYKTDSSNKVDKIDINERFERIIRNGRKDGNIIKNTGSTGPRLTELTGLTDFTGMRGFT